MGSKKGYVELETREDYFTYIAVAVSEGNESFTKVLKYFIDNPIVFYKKDLKKYYREYLEPKISE